MSTTQDYIVLLNDNVDLSIHLDGIKKVLGGNFIKLLYNYSTTAPRLNGYAVTLANPKASADAILKSGTNVASVSPVGLVLQLSDHGSITLKCDCYI